MIDRAAEPSSAWDPSKPDPAVSGAPYRIYNIGNHQPVKLGEFIEAIEEAVGRKAIQHPVQMKEGDVLDTYADVSDLQRDLGFSPSTPIREGIRTPGQQRPGERTALRQA